MISTELTLAANIEEALKVYLGTDSFPTDEWPKFARAVASLVHATNPGGNTVYGNWRAIQVTDVMEACARVQDAAALLVSM